MIRFLYFRMLLTMGLSLYTSQVIQNALGIEKIKSNHPKRVFVELHGVGRYATAYVSGAWIRRKDG